MNAYTPPTRIIPDTQAQELDRMADERAAEALARFQAQWPPERCKRLGDAVIGTPAEKAAANASYVADALARRADDSPADAAVRKLVKGHVAYNRGGFNHD